MPEHVRGIPYKDIRSATRIALQEFSERTNGDVRFNITAASGGLEPTPDKPYAGRSTADMVYKDEHAGTLTTVIFAPGEGSGSEADFQRNGILFDKYPHIPGVIPRSKKGVGAEIALTVASFEPDTDHEPVLYAGNLKLLTLTGNTLRKFGDIGQHRGKYQEIMAGVEEAEPTATFTVGSANGSPFSSEFRYGDPHAVYNGDPSRIQVVSFVAFDRSERNTQIIRALNPAKPFK